MSPGTDADGEAAERVSGLGAISRRLADCEDEDDVYWTVVESLDAVLEFDAATVYGAEDGQLRPLATAADDLYVADYPDAGEGIAGRVLRTGEGGVVEDLGSEPATLDSDAFRSALTVPLDDERGLQALSTDPGAFSEADLECARTVCAQAASALERVVTEREAQGERDEFAALFENVADPVLRYIIGDEGPVVDQANAARRQDFDVTADAVVGTPLDDLSGQREDDPPEWAAAREGERIERRLERRTADGLRQFLLRTVPGTPDAPTRTGSGYVIYVDVEESRRREQLEVLNRFLRHNVRNDVEVMRGHLDRVIESVDDPGVVDHVTTALRASHRLERRSQKARNAQELISETAGQRTTRFDLADVVADRVDTLRGEFPGADIEVRRPDAAVDVEAHTSLPLAVDELLENAVVHAGERPAVEVAVATGASSARVRIADDGPGIPERETRVVERGEETQLEHGSGIGLWLAAWVVDASDGELSFARPDDWGSVVTISLPRAKTE